MQHKQRLASEYLRSILAFGPRIIGSEGNRASAAFIGKVFEEAGLEVHNENYSAGFFPLILSSKIIALIAVIILLLIAPLFYSYPITVLMLLLILLVQVPLISWVAFGSQITRQGQTYPTCNVIGRTQNVDPAKPTIVFVAHYDSKSQSLNMAWRVIFFLLPVLICITLVLETLLNLSGLLILPPIVLKSMISLAVFCLIFQIISRTSNRSLGALDNASGTAILLSLAWQLPTKIANQANLIFLATDAEEVGLAGSIHYVKNHCRELQTNRTLVMNFDSISGRGRMLIVGGRRDRFFDAAKFFATGFERNGVRTCRFSFLLGVGLDHIPFGRAGFNAISFIQGVWHSGWRMHSDKDTIEGINEPELDRIADVFAEMAVEIAQNHHLADR
jgi:hypothetical protein